jgi:hypothetical protein
LDKNGRYPLEEWVKQSFDTVVSGQVKSNEGSFSIEMAGPSNEAQIQIDDKFRN